ncbi:hypothetical protein KP509_28G035100 [Ceratopteris richardii]|uniref:Uncharacterized protein n=1 Tax=Ceratopteris richardii TaxID=49495 RepID=A0A8T2RDQ8_CERRI|nr:hypothetical protein KP509_28G035100 [Ceratopteris richardii]
MFEKRRTIKLRRNSTTIGVKKNEKVKKIWRPKNLGQSPKIEKHTHTHTTISRVYMSRAKLQGRAYTSHKFLIITCTIPGYYGKGARGEEQVHILNICTLL